MKTINCIGCGKVGKTILKLIVNNHAGKVQEIVNQSIESANEAIKFIGEGSAVSKLEDLSPADIYFIATPDDKIQSICEELARKNLLKPNSMVFHFSGSLTSDILLSARSAGCFIASVHPVKSFVNAQTAVDDFPGTYMGMEGDSEALKYVEELTHKISGISFNITKENKRLYHAGMVMANNYLTTLHYHACKSLAESGVDAKIAKKLVSMLMNDSLNSVNKFDHQTALTGPLKRGDLATIKGHMQTLDNNPILRAIYSALGKGTLSFASHEQSVKLALECILSSDGERKKI